MRCPRCSYYMGKITNSPYLVNGAYFYKCNHCNYISDIYTDNNKPFGENYSLPADNDKGLEEWRLSRKYDSIANLKKEHLEIVESMQKKLGKITDDEEANLLIDIYLYNKKLEKKQRKTKKKKEEKDDGKRKK